jgi:cytochrome P450
MQSFCYHVLRDARINANLKRELDEATAAGRLSEMPQWNEVQALVYFQACLKEAMRLRPAVGLNITRLVPPEGAEIEGTRYPGGTRVAINAWVLHRDKATFGEDCKEFRPERWIEGDAKTMERYMFQVRTLTNTTSMRVLTVALLVWRRLASLHREKPRSA